MADEIRADDPVEGEYTDSEVPVDAAVPKRADADVNDGDWDGDEGVVVEAEGEYTDTDFDGDGLPERA